MTSGRSAVIAVACCGSCGFEVDLRALLICSSEFGLDNDF